MRRRGHNDNRITLEAGGGKSLCVANQLLTVGFDPFRISRFFEGVKTSRSDRLEAVAPAETLARGLLDTYQVWIPDDDTKRLTGGTPVTRNGNDHGLPSAPRPLRR